MGYSVKLRDVVSALEMAVVLFVVVILLRLRLYLCCSCFCACHVLTYSAKASLAHCFLVVLPWFW